ncbi:MAG: copper-translocating P-type ATPase [Spirochaetales bacterium]|nr:copper-translocating P-type ATPase [Spirochaetales bacterium]
MTSIKGVYMKKEMVLDITGMTCTSCAARIEKMLSKKPYITEVSVSFPNKKAFLSLNDTIHQDDVVSTIKSLGYEAKLKEEGKKKKETDTELKHLNKERFRLILAWAITLPLTVKMLLEMIFGIHLISPSFAFYTDLILAFPVIFIIGFPVIRSTLVSIKSFAFTMDSLIGIGTIAAYSSGILKLAGVEISSFAVVGAMIMSINFIGNYLKELATGRASQAIQKLLELGAKSAHLVKDDNSVIDVPVEELVVGDVVMVKPGEKIPIDGEITEGYTSVDESIATGESIPLDKQPGDKVIGATLNQQGAIKLRIEKVGKDTFLSQIITLVEQAQGSKVPIQAFADKVTSYFVPVILAISFLTFLFWMIFPQTGNLVRSFFAPFIPWIGKGSGVISLAIFASIATIVIACPCALGLATPTALMVGMGKGATNGILIRNGEAIQTAKKIDTVVFDKTGTITMGKPEVVAYRSLIDENDFFVTAGSLENLSEHPLARAIVKKSEEKNASFMKPEEFKAISGKGVSAYLNNRQVRIGSLSFISESGIKTDELSHDISGYFAKGYTIIGIAIEDTFAGIIAIADKIKPDSKIAVEKLHALGIRTVVLTGDNKKAASTIAKEAGIDEVYAELLPRDKIRIIKKLQDEGKNVAMVGDGINDAPALKQANIGIAIGTGTDIAIESADITLVSGSLTGVVKAITLSRATFRKILQNLFWAFFYNIIAIPLAVMGLLHPVIAEIAMAFSSINVVGNSLRLKNVKLD